MQDIEVITSRDNQKLKDARKVRYGKDRKSIFVEGLRLTEEALRSDMVAGNCFVSEAFLKNDAGKIVVAAVIGKGCSVYQVSDSIFKSLGDTDQPQGIVLICKRPTSTMAAFSSEFRLDPENIPVVVLLDEVNNPANIGAIVRTAEAAGAAGLIVSNKSADAFSPKALRSSMGSAFRLTIWENAGFEEGLAWAAERQFVTTAADIDGNKPYTQIDWKVPRLLIFGSEAHGLKEDDKKKIEDLVRIPINPTVESLNLAVSAGIILFEARRHIGG